MFSCFDSPLRLGLNPNDVGDLARSKRVSTNVLRLAHRTCDRCFVYERGSYMPPPVNGAIPISPVVGHIRLDSMIGIECLPISAYALWTTHYFEPMSVAL